jgi:hypothetical protein
MKVPELVEKMTKDLVDQGKIIEAGFEAMRIVSMHKEAPEYQIRDMRMAFFAGAQHLWSSVMSILEPGAEPTEKDLKRMNLIHEELQEWVQQMKAVKM